LRLLAAVAGVLVLAVETVQLRRLQTELVEAVGTVPHRQFLARL
jgi:hypothetical protein